VLCGDRAAEGRGVVTDPQLFHDPGHLRAHLAAELASWRLEGSWPLWRFQQFNRRVRLLARLAGRPRAEIHRELEADADAIEAQGEATR
jgi:hypothetical protein